MSRSPLFYPLNRGMDAESGGVADLQTDVMRFMAILALCLVAIFALVQSIPLMPTLDEPPPPAEVEAAQQAAPEPVATEPKIVELERPQLPAEEPPLLITRPAPQRIPRKRAPQRVIEQPIEQTPIEASAPIEAASEPIVPEVAPPPAPPVRSEGFTLRFETDLALTRLVARNEVGLYAITPEKALRMSVNRGTLSFWPASVPNQFHEMERATVPDGVRRALRHSGSVEINDVAWGVTLPRNMRRQLDRYLSEHQGGSLIIGGDGSLRLEP